MVLAVPGRPGILPHPVQELNVLWQGGSVPLCCLYHMQELYRWPKVAETGRKVLGLRYRLLPYFYTAFWTAHQSGAPVMRPLFLNFPQDRQTYNISRWVAAHV